MTSENSGKRAMNDEGHPDDRSLSTDFGRPTRRAQLPDIVSIHGEFEAELTAIGPLFAALRAVPGINKMTFEVPTGGPLPQAPREHVVGPDAKELFTGVTPSPTSTAAKANQQDMKRRAPPGAGRKLLLQTLAAGTSGRSDLIAHLNESGISRTSGPTILKKAKRDKEVTSIGGVYALTERGRAVHELAHPSEDMKKRRRGTGPKTKKAPP